MEQTDNIVKPLDNRPKMLYNAERFKCWPSAADKAPKKLGITRKKDERYKEQDPEKMCSYCI